jgi:hypothetical protein
MGGLGMSEQSGAAWMSPDRHRETQDVSGFDLDHPTPVEVRRSVTISVRFTAEEIESLRRRAEVANRPVTAWIREAALDTTRRPIDPNRIVAIAENLRAQATALQQAVY